MTTRAELVELADDEELLFADGFDSALLGVIMRCGQPPIVVYDRSACLAILMSEGLSVEQAEEHFTFNVEGSWVGERTPGYLVTLDAAQRLETGRTPRTTPLVPYKPLPRTPRREKKL
jgi:hypothetical protein